MLQKFKQELHSLTNLEKAKILQGFFKTGKGQYGEGDIFLGVTVPIQRKLVKKYFKDLNFKDIQNLLDSSIHEERFCGIITLVEKYKIVNFETKKEIYEFYLKNAKRINNWDLVDLSAPNIVGDFLMNYGGNFLNTETSLLGQKEDKGQNKMEGQEKTRHSEFISESIDPETNSGGRGKKKLGEKMEFDFNAGFPISREGQEKERGQKEYKGQNNIEILYKLSKSENLWERRIAIISTFTFIRKGNFADTINIAEILLSDKHDLIQKACGWMLREVGKRDLEVLRNFLNINIKNIPRTMLRYAIEKMNENERKNYLKK